MLIRARRLRYAASAEKRVVKGEALLGEGVRSPVEEGPTWTALVLQRPTTEGTRCGQKERVPDDSSKRNRREADSARIWGEGTSSSAGLKLTRSRTTASHPRRCARARERDDKWFLKKERACAWEKRRTTSSSASEMADTRRRLGNAVSHQILKKDYHV